MPMIVLDLEWNRGYDNKPLNEILQIGAVRLQGLDGPILSTFNIYIRPIVHKSFDPGAKQLPELRASLDSEVDFAAAIQLFRGWCGTETEYAFWGDDDLAAIKQNCAYWNVPAVPMEKIYNFQTALAYLLGTDQQIALWRAVAYFKIPDTFTFHSALNDALYTALVGRWLTPESLDYRPAPSKRAKPVKRRASLKLSKCPFPKQPRQTVGPFQTVGMVLDARRSRRPSCPVCGRRGCVNQWRLAPLRDGKPQQGFSVFSCPDHGRFLCRLILLRAEDGMWRGRLTVPAIRPELVQEYAEACEGSVYCCRSNSRNRRRPKRR